MLFDMNKQPNYPHPLPSIPPGMDYAKDSFWFRLRHKFMWKREIEAWAWYIQQRDKAALHGDKFPPAPVFAPKVTLPEPRTGREGDSGRVPWTGKE